MASYTFNRPAVFTADDMSELMSIIREVERLNGNTNELINQLYGLFDGVLYQDLLMQFHWNLLPMSLSRRIDWLVVLIKGSIKGSITIISPETVG